MKSSLLAAMGLALFVGCGPKDPIDRIVRRESANEYFGNGMYSTIPLPATASVAQVVGAVFPTAVKILTNREVRIGDQKYEAALVEDSVERKVVLLHFERHPTRPGWRSWTYND